MRYASKLRMTIIAIICALAIPASAGKWYEGGTLHQATGEHWLSWSQEGRLATSADYTTILLNRFPERTKANDLNICISEAALGFGKEPVATLAAACAILMGWR